MTLGRPTRSRVIKPGPHSDIHANHDPPLTSSSSPEPAADAQAHAASRGPTLYVPSMLADRPLNELLDSLGAEQPAPGGGAGAAWACALAAALVEMAAAFTRHERLAQVSDRARELRAAALELAERDLDAYAPVLEALRLASGDMQRDDRLAAALSAAAEPPLAVAEAASEVAALAAVLARTGNPKLRGDSITGATLAEAACRAAVSLVEINLASQPEDPRLSHAAELAARAADARAQALGPG